MKILMLVASLDTGGAETHVVESCRALRSLGHEVTVASGGGRLCADLGEIPHYNIDLAAHSPIKLFRSYISLSRLVKRINPDIIHSHSRVASFLGERVARKQKVRFVTTVHAEFSVSGLSRRLSRWGYYSIAVSDDLAVYLSANYSVCPDRISVISNGIDTDLFSPCRKTKSRILFVSRLDADCSEAAYSLCRLSHRLSERYGGIEIRIVGGGSEYERLSRIAQGINERAEYSAVTLAGNTNDVAGELSEAILFVGVGRCAIEAMSSGIPTIVAGNEGYFGALNEKSAASAARGNFCARGCEGISDGRLYADICALLDMSAEQREALGQSLRDFAIENNSIGQTAAQTVSFYRTVLDAVSFDPFGVCLCGYYGYGNTGDDTLLERAVIRAKGSGNGVGVCALTHSARRARYRFGIPCFNRYNVFSVIRAICRCHSLVFGGGTLFQDRTSLRSMAYYSAIACFAILLKKRVELWGNGLSEPKYASSKFLLKLILKRASYVGVRDKLSFDIALRYGADKNKVRHEGDLALSIRKDECGATPNTKELLKGLSHYAVFAVSARVSEAQYRCFKERAMLAEERGVSVIFVAMYPREDREKSRRLAYETGGIYAEGLSSRELVYILSKAEFCLSARLHLLVFAKIAGIPFEAVGDDPKLVAFCRENGGENKPFH